MEQKTKNNIGAAILFSLLIGWCSMPDKEIDAANVISVSDSPLKGTGENDDQQIVSVSFGESQTNYCSVAILRSNIKTGYSVYSLRRNKYQEISFDCNWDGVSYIQNENLDTYVELDVVSVDKTNKKAEIVLSSKLAEHKKLDEKPSGDSVELNKLMLVITGQHFDNLTKAM